MKSKTSAAVFLMAIFLLGGVSGGASYYIYQNHVAPAPASPGTRAPARHDIVEEMAQSLRLDAQQKEQLKAIFHQSRDRYSALSLGFRPQYEKPRAETNAAIRTILMPDQRQQFDDTLDKLDSRHRNHQHDGPAGPGQGPGGPGR